MVCYLLNLNKEKIIKNIPTTFYGEVLYHTELIKC